MNTSVDISIVIRTFNEGKWLGPVLDAVATQELDNKTMEVVLVDSGSTDETLSIAEKHGCRIVHIKKDEFTFGRSLNMGCDAAVGRALVFISGHCIPASPRWLLNLVTPLGVDGMVYTYGRQQGHEISRYSEEQLFRKYYPDTSQLPQQGFFCNNANSAILKEHWNENPYDEELTGLEDMDLAKKLVNKGHKIGYVADAPVIHIHEESWHKVKVRYEREAIALQAIMPELHVHFSDFLRYFFSGVMLDWGQAISDKKFFRVAGEVLAFRFMQYWGTYAGANEHRRLSRRRKEEYFYPR